MAIILDKSESPINRGIKTVGVGKKGSQPLSAELIREILEELRANRVTPAARGAFFAGLLFKGPTPEERQLEATLGHKGTLDDPAQLAKALAPDAPPEILAICQRILNKEELDKKTAHRLSQFLFSNKPGDGARGLVASALRVRYETADEYEGLLAGMQETLEPAFRGRPAAGQPIVQISEPFDGVDHSYLITPLLGRALQDNFRVIHMVGRNSGPKVDINLFDVMKALGIPPTADNTALAQPKPTYGWFYHQALISKPVDRWVELRHQTIKRPFLATLERFLNPAAADIIISSAFHPPYAEKMTTIAERAGFKGSISVRNGIEGTIAFPLKRAVKILCSARQNNGTYLRQELTFDPVEYLGSEVPLEEKIEKPKAADNAKLIELYIKEGKSGNELFDLRVKVTCAGLAQALQWIKENGLDMD